MSHFTRTTVKNAAMRLLTKQSDWPFSIVWSHFFSFVSCHIILENLGKTFLRQGGSAHTIYTVGGINKLLRWGTMEGLEGKKFKTTAAQYNS